MYQFFGVMPYLNAFSDIPRFKFVDSVHFEYST